MTVIKPDMLTGKVTRRDLLPMSFLNKSPYTGSKKRLRYRIEKAEKLPGTNAQAAETESTAAKSDQETDAQASEEPKPVKVLRVSTWTGPNAFDLTPAEEMTVRDYPYEDASLDAIIDWLNELLEDQMQKHY